MKKKLFAVFLLLCAFGIYFVFFHKDKTLKFVPESADLLILIDVKKVVRQTAWSFVSHPSQWGKSSKSESLLSSLSNSGLKIPDYLQVFHLKSNQIAIWHTVLEIEKPKEFLIFLKKHQFRKIEQNLFQRDHYVLKVVGKKCLLGNSRAGFPFLENTLLKDNNNLLNANDWINDSPASLSYLTAEKSQNFSIDFTDDEIEIKNGLDDDSLTDLLHLLEKQTNFLEAELDSKNIKAFANYFDKDFGDSTGIVKFKTSAELQQVKDTIITYTYDDDFNEIEEKSFQKVVQPNYVISFQSSQPAKTWEYFKNKKWINSEEQFTIIPFQPNLISRDRNNIFVKSTRKPITLGEWQNKNYLFIRNSPLLTSFYSRLSASEKKIISELDYIFYANRENDYYIKIKMKPGDFPFILRL